MPGDHGEESDEERRLREIQEALDHISEVLGPEVVQQYFLEHTDLGKMFDVIKDIALNSEDPLAREDARRAIEDRGLGFLLLPEVEEQ